MNLAGQPILILKEGTERSKGKDAIQQNINAARVIADSVRTSLGPLGLDKMLVDQFGDVVITNDGATIMKEIDVQHPAAKMMVEVSKTQDEETGDGTTTSVIITGELLKQAAKLLEQKIHPTVITEGYRKAADEALKIIEKVSIKASIDDPAMLKKVAMTTMGTKVVSENREMLADIAVKAIQAVAEKTSTGYSVDLDNIQILKKKGEGVEQTRLIEGIILDKEVVHSGMPKMLKNAKIALLESALEIEKTEFDAKLQINSPEQMQMFLDQEQKMLQDMVETVAKSGANAVFCQKGIDDLAQHFLAKKGIMAVRRIKKSDMDKLARATGGKIITRLKDLSPADLGNAGLVEERKVLDDYMVFVEQCQNAKSVVIMVRGGSDQIADENERSLHDGLCVVKDVVVENAVVVGGGAVEMEIAMGLRSFADSMSGREQLAVKAFADAIEVIPKTLAENAGLDQIDILMKLRSAHGSGKVNVGVSVLKESEHVTDMLAEAVVEPALVKKQAIKSAAECATLILRIDDVIAAQKSSAPPGGPGGGMGGMPPGMGGMGGMPGMM
ncbi:MAG: thermosome subunit [Candidatus Lokiarchaeota archaeon]|nr:thermosome subunit [Candidatus Lokiarchaeota archaeon]